MESLVTIPTVKITRHLEAADEGTSNAQVFADETGKQFLVKFKENDLGTAKILANELVANALGSLLGLPIPQGAIVEVDDLMLNSNPDFLTMYGHRISTGYHYGTQFIGNAYRQVRSLIANASNKADFPGVIVFDILTNNHDRDNDGNFLIVPDPAPSKETRFVPIDHGNCFGNPHWDISIKEGVGTWCQNTMPELAYEIKGKDPFDPFLEKLKAISDGQIQSVVLQIPDEWSITAAEKQALIEFISKQRDEVEHILIQNKLLFPLWK